MNIPLYLTRVQRLWLKVHEPRTVSVLRFLMYLGFLFGGLSAVSNPPSSIEGAIGQSAMLTLASLLAFGGFIGAIAALPGIWWLERVALLAIIMSATIYGTIIATLHIQGDGNRSLQLSFVFAVILSQFVRWARIKERPYDPTLRSMKTPVI